MMRKTWRMLGVMTTLSVAACSGCNNSETGSGEDSGVVCTGTYSGGATGKVKFCSLNALKTSDGTLQYTLEIEPDASSTVQSNDNLTVFGSGDPKKGTFALETFTTAVSRVTLKGDKDYELLRNGGEQTGKASLTIDSVPAATNLTGGNYKYDAFTGSAEIQYAAPAGAPYSDTVTLKLSFQKQ